MWGSRAVAVVAGIGLAGGILLGILTYVLAAAGPSGPGWSLRGNGALIVPFGLGPALLAAGWTAIAGHFRSLPNWMTLGLGAGLVGVALVAASLVALAVGGSVGTGSSAVLSLLAGVWMFVAPLLAGFLPAPDTGRSGGLGVHLLAALVLVITVVAAIYVTQRVLPPGS
jgi:hypothetical protein